MMLFQLLFHGRFDLVGVFQAHGHHAQRVANEIQREMVLHDLGIAFEDRGIGRLFDMGFQGDQALGLHGLGEKKQQAQLDRLCQSEARFVILHHLAQDARSLAS